MAKAPNKFLAPVVIAGITVGFLAGARRFIFVKSQRAKSRQNENQVHSPEGKDEEMQNND
ncbi:hypothetical protein [uncultured Acinetobacter sp.]|uniref:hypothetical protein n=1 Tax=uncultured Acinetobacter sp. TaxID=165433 RepID=UPI00261AA59D|nr:hypothetical protein [uncultured Acinetobacter sp.]